MALPVVQPHLPGGVVMYAAQQAPVGGITLNPGDPPDCQIDIGPNQWYMAGLVIVYAGGRVRIERGDKLWYTYKNTSGRTPHVPVMSNFYTNRNFGPVSTLRRSNVATIGVMDQRTYELLHQARVDDWDRSHGPRYTQHYKRRVNVVAWDQRRGSISPGNEQKVRVIITWGQ